MAVFVPRNSVGGPADPGLEPYAWRGEVAELVFEVGVEPRFDLGWQVVVAGALVADRSGEQHEVRRGCDGCQLSCRGDAQEQLAAGGEELLGDKDSVR